MYLQISFRWPASPSWAMTRDPLTGIHFELPSATARLNASGGEHDLLKPRKKKYERTQDLAHTGAYRSSFLPCGPSPDLPRIPSVSQQVQVVRRALALEQLSLGLAALAVVQDREHLKGSKGGD